MKPIGVCLLGVAALFPLFAAAPPAEAQNKKTPVAKNLDFGLIQKSPGVMQFLADEKKARSVGVLPFQVQKGGRDASYDAAPLAAALPGRLENALIMTMTPDEQKAMKVIRDAAAHASKSKVGAWSKDKAAFNKLFSTSYPVAWGNESVKPDIFLTGTISNTGDRATTVVKVMGFTRDDWDVDQVKMFPVATLTVRTDRALLRDLGYNYVLNTAVAKRGNTAADRDRDAVEKVNEAEAGTATDASPKPIDIGGVRFDILYNDVVQPIRALSEGSAAGAKSPLFQVDPVQPGTAVKVTMTRLSAEGPRLGVIVKLNGLSLFGMDDRDSMQCRKWLLEGSDQGKKYTLDGFWMDSQGKDVRKLRVLTAEESAQKSADLGDRAGWIDLDVFSVGEEPQPEEQLMVSTRGLSRKAKKPATLKELHTNLLAANNVRVKTGAKPTVTRGGLIIADLEPTPGTELVVQERLKNPVRLGGVSIKYYDRAKD